MSAKSHGIQMEEEKRSNRSLMGGELNKESDARFDEGKIIDHYVKLKDFHQKKLSSINMSEQLKRKLFGFSEAHYLTNAHDPYKLLIENHPLKGRAIMSEQKLKNELQNRKREREVRSNFSMDSQSCLHIDSDLDQPFPQESLSQDASNPQFVRSAKHPQQE